jgi:molybdopterin molybdotransferase
MDGFAVHAADLAGASDDAPVHAARHRGGEGRRLPDEGGRTWRGDAHHDGCAGAHWQSTASCASSIPRDGGDGSIVLVLRDSDAGRNVRLRGEDLQAGESVFAAGRLLRVADIGVLAMIGCTRPLVSCRPAHRRARHGRRAGGCIETSPTSAAGTHIIDSNTPSLAAALARDGVRAGAAGHRARRHCRPAPATAARARCGRAHHHGRRKRWRP